MSRMRIFTLVIAIGLSLHLQAKKAEVNRIDPPSWWVGMNNQTSS